MRWTYSVTLLLAVSLTATLNCSSVFAEELEIVKINGYDNVMR